MRHDNTLNSADPDGVSAQIDLIGVPWLNIGFEPSAAPNGGDACAAVAGRRSHNVTRRARIGWAAWGC
jgi:hypothetical protein